MEKHEDKHESTRIWTRTFTKILCFFVFVFVFFCVSCATAQAGFGVSPPSIKETRLVPGSRITRTIYLIQGNPEKDVSMDVAVESKDIKDWLSFEPAGSFTIPAGVQQFPLKVTVVVPEDAELGIYKAFIRPSTNPENAKSGVAISLGGRIDVELTVGNDVRSEEHTLNSSHSSISYAVFCLKNNK